MNLITRFIYLLNAVIPYKKQTFTYFIPAPPIRKSGYREKAFDSIIQQLTNLGFKIIDLNATTINDSERLGMWVVVIVAPYTAEAMNHDPSQFPEEFINMVQDQSNNSIDDVGNPKDSSKAIELPSDGHEEDEIKGIYYID